MKLDPKIAAGPLTLALRRHFHAAVLFQPRTIIFCDSENFHAKKIAEEKPLHPPDGTPLITRPIPRCNKRWARELIARIQLRGDEHILDVGCGDGKVTAEIARAVPRGSATGIDASPQMIAFAKKTFPRGKFSNLEFQVMDAREISIWAAVRHDFFQRRPALGGRPSGRYCAGRRGCSKRADGWWFPAADKGNAQDVFLALRPEMRLKRWREYFPQNATALFFL